MARRDREEHQPLFEDTEEATLEGDVSYRAGSVRAALAHRPFRRVFTGAFLSNIGTWMQNVALGVFAYNLTKSASFVALLGFAQLGPLLVLSIVGGALADAFDRKKLLIICQLEQLVLSLLLAFIASQESPSKVALFLCVLAIGVGNALNAPAFSAVLPILVGRRDLPGAVSLQSFQMNATRVIGPAIGGLVLPTIGAAGVFAANAATYVFVIAALATIPIPRPYPTLGEQGLRRLISGFAYARRSWFVRECLLTMFAISLFSLAFIGLLPVIAAENLGMDPRSFAYGALFAGFGLGAAIGAISIGTLFVDRAKYRMVPLSLLAFAVLLAIFGFTRGPTPAYPVLFLVGLAYFMTVTALSTTLQEHLDDSVRGRVMALWIMAFGGTVPIGLLIGGAVAERTSVTTVMEFGAIAAAVLAVLRWTRPLVPRPGDH